VNNSIDNKMGNIDILVLAKFFRFYWHQEGVLINETRDYHRYLGGSPTNVAMNSTRLGLNATMVATVGDDGFDPIFEKLSEVGVNTSLKL
jgi:fructokinase